MAKAKRQVHLRADPDLMKKVEALKKEKFMNRVSFNDLFILAMEEMLKREKK